MTVAILWLTYTAYLVLRGTMEEPVRRARFAAVFGLLATVNVPLVHFAIRLFKPVHHPAQATMAEAEMVVTRWVGAFAFLVLYTALWRLRYRVHLQRARCHELEEGLLSAGL
jgi:heme exporter protein C